MPVGKMVFDEMKWLPLCPYNIHMVVIKVKPNRLESK